MVDSIRTCKLDNCAISPKYPEDEYCFWHKPPAPTVKWGYSVRNTTLDNPAWEYWEDDQKVPFSSREEVVTYLLQMSDVRSPWTFEYKIISEELLKNG